jgi:hypothetical protein
MTASSSSKSRTGHEGFDFWKDEFTSVVREIEAALHQQDDATELVQRASSILPNLVLEVRNVSNDPPLKQELMDIYRACKMQLETYQTLNEQKELFQLSRSTKNGTTTSRRDGNSSGGGSSSKREQIEARTQGRVAKQNSQLQAALRSLKESEEIAREITGELHQQRGTIQRAQGRMSTMKDMTQQAKGIVKSMNKKWWQKW